MLITTYTILNSYSMKYLLLPIPYRLIIFSKIVCNIHYVLSLHTALKSHDTVVLYSLKCLLLLHTVFQNSWVVYSIYDNCMLQWSHVTIYHNVFNWDVYPYLLYTRSHTAYYLFNKYICTVKQDSRIPSGVCVCASEVVRLSSDFAQFKSSHALSPSCIHSWLNIFVFSQNLQWARDVLLGSSVPWQQLKHMPAQGLFCERNKTNLFNVSHICMQLCLNVKVHRITATAWSSLEILVMCVYLAERVCCSYTCVMYAIMSSCDSVQ